MAKITKRTADAAAPRGAEYTVWDDEVRGFGLRVWPTGRKVFVLRYQLGGRAGRTQRVTIGDYGTLTPEQARREAIRLRGEVAAGRSPADERQSRRRGLRAEREAPTIDELAVLFLADRAAKKKGSTVAEYRRLLNRDVLPSLGALHVVKATRTDIAKLHCAMSGRPYLANRALAVLGAMFRYAELHGLRSPHTNPCTGIERYPEHPHERFLSRAEFAAIGAALRRAETTGLAVPPKLRRQPKSATTARRRSKSAGHPIPANPVAVAAIRFLMLSGWREGEVLALRWDELDLERGLATLANTKTGRSLRFIGQPCLDILGSVPRIERNPHVFPGRKPGDHLRELKRLWDAVRHEAGVTGVRLHDLRHSHASVAVGAGKSLPIIGALLGHREVDTTQRYAHLGADPLRRAADDVSAEIASALAGDERTLTAGQYQTSTT